MPCGWARLLGDLESVYTVKTVPERVGFPLELLRTGGQRYSLEGIRAVREIREQPVLVRWLFGGDHAGG
jgi:hypothetical protein